MAVPSRPADQRLENIGFYYQAPTDNNLYKINNDLANQNYVSDCVNESTNADVPTTRFEISNYSDSVTEENLIFRDEDGTVRRYFIHGDETISDFYCDNIGVTSAEYEAMVPSAQALFCDEVGGKITHVDVSIAGSQLDSSSDISVYDKSTTGTGATFTPIISNPSFSAGLNNISNHDLAQVSQIIADVSDLDGVDYSLTPTYDFQSLSGQETSAIREKCRYFIRDIYYRYLGREADESGLFYYANKIYDIFVSCAFGDCKYWLVNDLVVQEIRNSPEGLQYQERLKAGTVVKPEYVLTSFGSYTQPEKWKSLWGNYFFAESFRSSGGGSLIDVKIDQAGQGYLVGDTFGVRLTNNDDTQSVDAEFTITQVNLDGSIRYLKTPTCDVAREISRPVGVEIWNAPDQTTGNNDCPTENAFIGRAIVEGTVGGVVFGSGPYTNGSEISTAVVHAGLIGPGDLAEVSWYSAGSNKIPNFSGSTRNGVTSFSSDTSVTGIIKSGGLNISNPGKLINSSYTVKPKNVNGTGAGIKVVLNASFNVISVEVEVGGNNYQVGDTFEVVSNAVGFNETPAILTVTNVETATVSGLCGINLKLDKIISPDSDICQPDQEILTISVDQQNPDSTLRYLVEKDIGLAYADSSRNRLIDQVQDIDGSGSADIVLTQSASLTLNVFMSKISRLPAVVEFQQYTRLFYASGAVETDEINNKFDQQFQDELNVTDQVTSVTTKCDREQSFPDNPLVPDENPIALTSDSACTYDRSTFYQPSTEGYSLQEIWNFFGRPKGYSGANTGTTLDQIVCGRPASENLVQDNEPDMSDFAGLRVQRWQPCTDGSNSGNNNLGGVFIDIVPCPNAQGDCVNETYETELAIFNQGAKITFNDGFQKLGDFVTEAKDSQAVIINDTYMSLFKRPAEREGLEYWVNEANKTITGTNAIFWPNGKIVYANGTEATGNFVKETTNNDATLINQYYLNNFGRPAEDAGLDYWVDSFSNYKPFQGTNAILVRGKLTLNDGFQTENNFVQTPSNEFATAINNQYISILGRPAEQAGLDYWVQTAQSAGISATLDAIKNAAPAELARGGVKSLLLGEEVLFAIMQGSYEANEGTSGGVTKVVVGIDRTLEHLAFAGQNELARGGVDSYKLKCEWTTDTQLDLSWFRDTRMPPWWGTLSLATPQVSLASAPNDTIYLINSPANQNEIYMGFAGDNNSSDLKNEFELNFAINWPQITGEVEPGYNNPAYRKYIKVSWIKNIPGQPPELRAVYRYSNVPELEPEENFKNGVDESSSLDQVDFITNSNLSQFKTTLTVDKLSSGEMTKSSAEDLSYDSEPNLGTNYFVKVTVENVPIDNETGSYIPTLGGTGFTTSAYNLNDSCKFILNPVEQTQTCPDGSIIPITSTCPNTDPCTSGTKVCSNGAIVCRDDVCPGGDTQGCNSLSVSCGSNEQINVAVNSNTSIKFNYRVNNAQNCSTSGTAKVSIRRYWPCPIFGPASGVENQWLVQKQSVSIVNGVAEYTLKVNTARDDYLPTNNESQTADNPGNCHWVYEAYWEIDHPNIQCRPNAWQNPGCNTGGGFNLLEEILCIQKSECQNIDPPSNCSDCPICEQTIKVIISQTTECGPVNFPSMIESSESGTINNGKFKVGDSEYFIIPNSAVTNLSREQTKISKDSSGKEYVNVRLFSDVVIAPAVVGDQITAGRNNAVEFSGVDYDSLITKCCGDSTPATFECINFVKSGGCNKGGLPGGLEVDCNATMRVVAHWYYKYTYNNGTTSDYLLLEHLKDGVPDNQVSDDFYPASAGNNPSALNLVYQRSQKYELGKYEGSYFANATTRKLYYPSTVKSVEIFMELKASNDEWAKAVYHPPPAGWDEDDFGIDLQVSSLRWPWRLASIYAYGPKDKIFSIGKFSISNTLQLPTVDWILSIDGCSDAQVYAPLDYDQGGTYLCGDKNSPNWYECKYSRSDGKNSVANETWRLNGVDGTSNGGPAFYGKVCAPELVGFPDCLPETDVVLTANTQDRSGLFPINWNDVSPVQTCQGGLKILWYVDGRLVTDGQLNDPYKAYEFLSCGEKTADLSRYMTDPDRAYQVRCFVVLNNGNYVAKKPVNFDWSTQNGDPYSYSQYTNWAVKRSVSGDYPININENIRAGDFYQIILSEAGCVVKGNSGSGQPPEPGVAPENPSADINVTVNGPSTVTLENGTATMEFTATVTYNNGNFVPTPEPSRLTYGRNNQFANNATTFTWTETFTEPGTYNIPAKFRKNYCPPGTVASSTCSGKSFVVVNDSVSVTVEQEVVSTKPTATVQPATYSYSQGGCGLSINGSLVTVTMTISLAPGTGIYQWDDVQTTTGRWVLNGSTLVQTIGRSTTSSGSFGTIVIFLKNGKEVHREASGQESWCVNAVSLPGSGTPFIPGSGIQP